MCKHFENIEGWIQISILDVLFFVRRKTLSYNYLVKKLLCLLTIILPHILSVYMLVLFISLFASLLALVILVLSLPGCKFLLSMNWIYETQKNKTWILSDLYWLYWLALNDLMGNLVFIRIVEETILTFNCCWIPNLLFKETEVTPFCFAGI